MSSGPGQPAMPIETVILFKNYTFSTPDAGLFAIPADYTKADSVQEIMMESMGSMMAPPPQ
jgi:S-adenosylmethionine hydrolase